MEQSLAVGAKAVTLPANYEHATRALAALTSIDECLNWADKAAALASYAKQAGDDMLFMYARRVQVRATRRSGELLRRFPSQVGRPVGNCIATGTIISQHQAASGAGMSKRQEVTAVRVANVPVETFTAAVESAHPPTVTKLAKMGTEPRARPERDVPPTRVKPLDRSPAAAANRRARMRQMAAEAYSSPQIAAALGMTLDGCRHALRDSGIVVPADLVVGGHQRHNSTRIMEHIVMDAEGVTADIGLINYASLDHAQLRLWIVALVAARSELTKFIRRLEKESEAHVKTAS